MILVWAIYSSFFTPFEFGFFRGLQEKLFILDIVGQVAFLVDIILQFFVAYRDSQTYRMVYKRTPIALRFVSSVFLITYPFYVKYNCLVDLMTISCYRYLKSGFILDLLGCMPWDNIYKVRTYYHFWFDDNQTVRAFNIYICMFFLASLLLTC